MLDPQAEGKRLETVFRARGFNSRALVNHRLFQEALRQYAGGKTSIMSLLDIAEKLAIFAPSLKQQPPPNEVN